MLEVLRRNWPLKLLALVMAFAIWVSTSGEREAPRDFTIALKILHAPDQTLSSEAPTSITVRLAGRESLIRRLDPLRLGATVDLSNSTTGPHVIHLTTANLTGVPGGIDLDFINPDRLSLVVDKLARVQLPVEPTFTGKPPDGYTFYGATVHPKKLTIEGPATAVDPLTSLSTHPIRLSDLTQPETIEAATVIADQMIRVVDPWQLEVRIIVDTDSEERLFKDIPVALAGQLYESSSSPALSAITLSGPSAVLDNITVDMFKLVADLTDLEPRTTAYRLRLRLDYTGLAAEDRTRIKLKSIDPVNVRVTIDERRIGE